MGGSGAIAVPRLAISAAVGYLIGAERVEARGHGGVAAVGRAEP